MNPRRGLSVIVDYGMGNLASIQNMARKAGGDLVISSDADEIAGASGLILPGVGAFDRAMEKLQDLGLIEALNYAALGRGVKVLGICLGLQLLCRRSEEGIRAGLGWIEADTVRFRIARQEGCRLRVPHMGWNVIEIAKEDPLLAGLPSEARFYFVHSYHVACDNETDVLTWTTHGVRFASSVQRGNIRGTQFHPEKSHQFGLALIRNFLALP